MHIAYFTGMDANPETLHANIGWLGLAQVFLVQARLVELQVLRAVPFILPPLASTTPSQLDGELAILSPQPIVLSRGVVK